MRRVSAQHHLPFVGFLAPVLGKKLGPVGAELGIRVAQAFRQFAKIRIRPQPRPVMQLGQPARIALRRILRLCADETESFQIDELLHSVGFHAGIHAGDIPAEAMSDKMHG